MVEEDKPLIFDLSRYEHCKYFANYYEESENGRYLRLRDGNVECERCEEKYFIYTKLIEDKSIRFCKMRDLNGCLVYSRELN